MAGGSGGSDDGGGDGDGRHRSGVGGRSVCGGEEGGGRSGREGGRSRRGEEERGRRRGEEEGKGGGQPWRGGGSNGGAAAARAGSRSMVMRSRRAHVPVSDAGATRGGKSRVSWLPSDSVPAYPGTISLSLFAVLSLTA